MTKIVVLDAETLAVPPSQWDRLRAFGECAFFQNTPHDDSALITERCQNAQVVLTNKVPLSADVLNALPRLACVCVLATGYNVIDTRLAREKGICLCNVPAYGTDCVVQHTLALLLELTNRVAAHSESVHQGDWTRSGKFWYQLAPIHELAGKTAGIVGFGTIGRKVGAVLHAMGMRILADARTRRDAPDWPDFAWASADEIFARGDVVSLHCPLTEQTQGLVNAARLASMKPGALLINTARGPLVDEKALARALQTGPIGGAALDVLSTEPMRVDSPLLNAPNCVITPHVAWASEEAMQRLFEITVGNVGAFLDGAPRNVVN